MRTVTLLIAMLLCFIQGVYAAGIPDGSTQAADSIADKALDEVVVKHQTVKRSAQGDLIRYAPGGTQHRGAAGQYPRSHV